MVLALGDEWNTVLDVMPSMVATQNWPSVQATEQLDALVRSKLGQKLRPIRETLDAHYAQKLSKTFLGESSLPQPQSLHGLRYSLPPGIAVQSLGSRFVGRSDLLRNIHRVLSEGNTGVAQVVSVVAGGGFGKTRLAIEYLYRYGRDYPGGIFWVNAASNDAESELWRVLSALETDIPDLSVMRGQVWNVNSALGRALRKIPLPALYIVDNIPEANPGKEPLSIGEFCPALGAVSVLATSRQEIAEQNVRKISVDVLDTDSAILLLTDNVLGAPAISWADWGRVATWVGQLPVALDVLNMSLALGSISPPELLKRVHSPVEETTAADEVDRLREALRGHVPENAVHGVADTFLISYRKLDDTTQLVAQLLGQLAPAPIPEAFMEALPDEWRSPGVRTPLRSRHFLAEGGGLSFGIIHTLMADFLRSLAGDNAANMLLAASNTLLKVIAPVVHQADLPLVMLCRPHAEELFTRGSKIKEAAVTVCSLGLAAGYWASEQADYIAARRLHERVVEVFASVLGEEHPDTLKAMKILSDTIQEQGNYGDALKLAKRVMEVFKRLRGEEDPDTVTCIANVAKILRLHGEYTESRRLQEVVLEVRRRQFGEEHPATLDSMSQLGLTIAQQGDLDGAKQLQERVLNLNRRVHGEEDSHTLGAMSDLAESLRRLGDHGRARQLQEHLLESLRPQGEENASVLLQMNNLGLTLWAQGDYPRAKRLQEHVFKIHKRVFGEEHPKTLTSMNNLALTLQAMGDLVLAREINERVVKISARVLGEEHPHTLTSKSNLAETLWAQGDQSQALLLELENVAVKSRVLGADHPDTNRTVKNIAAMLSSQLNQGGLQGFRGRVFRLARACWARISFVFTETYWRHLGQVVREMEFEEISSVKSPPHRSGRKQTRVNPLRIRGFIRRAVLPRR